MRSRDYSVHMRKGNFHIMLPSTTTGGTRTSLQGHGELTSSAPTPCPRHGRGLARRLGRRRPKIPPHHISPLCEMERADNPHLSTTPTTTTGLLHRSPHPLGSQPHNTPNREHTKHSLSFSGPPWGLGQDFPPHSYICGNSPSPPATSKGTHIPIPRSGTYHGGMEI